MNKAELIDAVVDLTGLSRRDSSKAVVATFEAITNAMAAGEPVQLVGFGTFKANQRAARTARNPQNGDIIEIPATRAPGFKAGKKLKEAVAV